MTVSGRKPRIACEEFFFEAYNAGVSRYITQRIDIPLIMKAVPSISLSASHRGPRVPGLH